MVTDQQRSCLVEEARAATSKAFLTAPSATSYGAAVLSLAGKIYSAGQYSSWNHVTNIHAEQGALLLAAMADDADVLALAIASSAEDPVARPCGVCRQVMKEHADRTGRDFEVLMAHRNDNGFDRSTVSELLPLAWTAQSQTGSSLVSPYEVKYREGHLRPGELAGGQLLVGDHVVLRDDAIAIVWDGCLENEVSLVKVKYTPHGEGGRRKIAHSFTDPLRYQAELHAHGWARETRMGAIACIARSEDVSARLPALPLEAIGDKIPGSLLEVGSECRAASAPEENLVRRCGRWPAADPSDIRDVEIAGSPLPRRAVGAAFRAALHRHDTFGGNFGGPDLCPARPTTAADRRFLGTGRQSSPPRHSGRGIAGSIQASAVSP